MMHALLFAAGGALAGGLLASGLTALALRRGQDPVPEKLPEPPPFLPARARLLMAVEQVVSSLPAASLVLDQDRRQLYASPQAYRQFGESVGSIERHPAFQGALDRLATRSPTRGEEIEEARIVLDVPMHRIVRGFFQKKAFPKNIFASEEERSEERRTVLLTFVVLYDVTEAEITERQHADFVAFASHELRTPLAALMGFIETLQGPAADDPEAQKEFLGIMAAQGRRMQRLLDGLLYLSRVQMLEHQRPRGQIRLGELCSRLQSETSILFRQKNAAELVVVPPDNPHLCVAGDEDQMLQVLINLVENALKYGACHGKDRRESALKITVSCAEVPSGGGWPTGPGFVLQVADNGPGIAARHLPRLTERFYRVPKTSAIVQGSGLGLAIVQHIITRHGGRFVVDSTVGEGTTCKIWLPLGDATAVIKT
ncbi:two-component sensor histidine kinase [Acetobacter senegalensis]|uniref:sensor histidine kinase n=1 Tax=Acetobacter senegalensis TaxID=446692 RepID=UPI001EDAEC74|nr:ATP-binding protein [Acetobacter senegalensis]MCG4254759.1 two-component sensor histidine kinase [Acetobacter senegalensis]